MVERIKPKLKPSLNNDPYLDGGVKGWIMNTALANHWKVAAWYELDDLVQDGYLCYAKCRKGFRPISNSSEPTADDRRLFMAFFQRSFQNHITDLANKRSDTPESAVSNLPERQADALESWAASAAELSEGSLATLLAQAPTEILDLLKQILVDGVANGPYLRSRLRKKCLPSGGIPRITKARRLIRETTEQHYDRCLGQPGVIDKLREYFLGDTANGGMVEKET